MTLSRSRARKALVTVTSAALLAALAAASPGASAAAPDRGTAPHWYGLRPTNGGQYTTNGVSGDAKGAKPGGGSTSNGINYHGGPVMTATKHMYYIWYGNWSGDTATTILPGFANAIGGSPYFNINTTYYDGSGAKVSNSVTLAGQTTDSYSRGATNLSDADILAIVTSAISSGRLPSDTDGVYFVLTSVDVQKSGFLTQYCGWHTNASIGGADIKYSFVGDAGTNSACLAQTTSSPNGNVGADGMVSVIAHELEEAATDPDLNAWYDRRGYENADKCAWTFGTESTASNGSKYNVTLGGSQYLIQRNWVNAGGGYCSMSY